MIDKKLSVVIPIYNEEPNIEVLYQRLSQVLQAVPYQWELIFVNDGSKDASGFLVKQLRQKDRRVKYIEFSRNFGHQVAVTAGINHAFGDMVVIIDADLQDPPELILEMIKKWEEGYEVVYAKRKKRKGETWFKLFTAKLFYRLLRKITNFDIPLDTGDFRLIDKKVAENLRNMPERSRFIRGMVAWSGFRTIGIEYERHERYAGETKYPFRKMLRFAIDGITSFSYFPLQLASYLGIFFSGISFMAIIVVLYLYFFTDKTIHGWTSTILAVLFIGGIQLFTLGIIGEYLARIGTDVKQRPIYIIREKQLED
ncbi:MAG: glycosyltransferase family 2 protein [Bacteroidia bacterium]|nr:glycosyltransferase family 2 protein [Bacteroidia bacterium]MDW8302210.1 glycosyltransferase family 2 protein [Bacteroidia bacterium]